MCLSNLFNGDNQLWILLLILVFLGCGGNSYNGCGGNAPRFGNNGCGRYDNDGCGRYDNDNFGCNCGCN